jgi:pilus assembly protein CpaE
MKIAIISPNRTHLETMTALLEAQAHTVTAVEGGKSRMRDIAEDTQPDLMLVEGMCCDPGELAPAEYVTTRFPQIAVMLLCATHTPEFLINSMRAGVREVLPSPVAPAALQSAVARVAAKLTGGQSRGHGRVLAFIGCKGGSGATFLATNIGYQLAEDKTVLLIDLNLQFGDALTFVHDEEPRQTLADIAHDINRLDASFLAAVTVRVSPNYSILAAPADPSQALEIKPEHVEAILNLAVTQYDFVLLDLGRTLDTLTVKALDRAYRIFPVLQAGVPFIRGTRKLLGVFKSLGYPPEKIELIINRHEKGAEIDLGDISRSLGVGKPHTVSNSYRKVNASISIGDPLIASGRSNPVTRNLADFARELNPAVDPGRNLLGRLFGRA